MRSSRFTRNVTLLAAFTAFLYMTFTFMPQQNQRLQANVGISHAHLEPTQTDNAQEPTAQYYQLAESVESVVSVESAVSLVSTVSVGYAESPETTASSAVAIPTPALAISNDTIPERLEPSADNLVLASEVALILKTGSSYIWRRLPAHLLTTFASGRVPNFAIYSDAEEKLPSNVQTVDALANVSTQIEAHDHRAYQIYLEQKQASARPNVYREQAGLLGDTLPDNSNDGNPDGWVLDRYKFLPMLEHAYRSWPTAKWFVYIEDDTFLFWYNIRQWLAKQDHQEIAYLGAISGPENETFAQGGSGIVFSQALMKHIFGSEHIANLDNYGNLTAESCCGDILLGDVLRDYGVSVNRGEFGTQLFRPEPPWKTRFDVSIWCEPVMTFHHLHQQDIAVLAALEEDQGEENRPKILFRDVFLKLVAPYLAEERIPNWDNYADFYVLRGNHTLPEDLRNYTVSVADAIKTADGCQRACNTIESCFSWRHEGNTCSLDPGTKLGRAIAAGTSNQTTVTSGWMLPRLNDTLLSHECWGFRE